MGKFNDIRDFGRRVGRSTEEKISIAMHREKEKYLLHPGLRGRKAATAKPRKVTTRVH